MLKYFVTRHRKSQIALEPIPKEPRIERRLLPVVPSFSQTRQSRAAGSVSLFWALVLIQVATVWCVRYVPTTDGPSHLDNAIILRDYYRPDHTIFREYLALNVRPVPNWVAPLVETTLASLMPPLVAEKLLLSIYLLLLPLAVLYAVTAIDRRAAGLALAAIPLAANFYLHEGLFNYCFSLVFFFFAIGFWLEHGRHLRGTHAVGLCLLLGALYFAHLVGLAMAGVLIGGMILWRGDWRPGSSGFGGSIRTVAAATPWLALTIWFVSTEHSGRAARLAARHTRPWAHRLVNVLSWMKSFRPEELLAAGIEVALVGGLVFWLLRSRSRAAELRRRAGVDQPLRARCASRWDGLLVIAGLYGLFFLAAPQAAAGGSMIVIRLACFPLFALFLWSAGQVRFATRSPLAAAKLRGGVAILAVIITLMLTVSHTASYWRIRPYLAEFADAERHIPAGATLLPIYLSDGADVDPHGRRLSSGSSPLVEAAGNFAAQRGILNLDNYEASVDYFPLQFRKDVDPYPRMIDSGEDIAAYETASGKTVDYVLLWTGGIDVQGPAAAPIVQRLRGHYRPVFRSGHCGYAWLFRRQDHDHGDSARVD